jgi:hypothetical protein
MVYVKCAAYVGDLGYPGPSQGTPLSIDSGLSHQDLE